MNIIPIIPPRKFKVGFPEHRSIIKDCAHIELEEDEQVTFILSSGSEYDVVRKDWGFYATPSLNNRLLKFHLHAALVKNRDGQYYILLVEEGKEDSFFEYVRCEKMDIIAWLDNPENFKSIEGRNRNPESERCCPICGNSGLKVIFQFNSPPSSEMQYDFSSDNNYCRKIFNCNSCRHYISVHEMDDSSLYSGDYVNSNYCDERGIHEAYNQIMSLDPSKSDNYGRVKSVLDYANKTFHDQLPPIYPRSVLDIGSGLCVFLSQMKDVGWICTALDTDPRLIKHASTIVGVNTIFGDFLSPIKIMDTFDLITFNRVLEHVKNPQLMLKKANSYLKQDGFIYIEVPDGEMAVNEGLNREEFTIDHLHIFSFHSLVQIIINAGLTPSLIERIREPSGKYTLRAICRQTR